MIKINGLLRRRCYAILLLLGCGVASASEDYIVSAAEITGYGVFQSTFNERRRDSTSKAPPADLVTGVRFLSISTKIPLILGTNFGLEYVINTTPIGAKLEVTSVIRFPEGGLVSPSGKIYTQSEESYKVVVGEATLHGYGFDETWEMVPGVWTFEIWYRGAKLVGKNFTVSPLNRHD